MSLVELTEVIVKSLVKNHDDVSIKGFDDEDIYTIEVIVSGDSIGSVIGSKGRIINAIRTVVQASSYLRDNKKVQININSI